MATPLEVYIESGAKRVFAGVLIWPGLVRSAKTEMAALQALVDYGPRYQKVMGFAHRETNEVWQFGLADLLVVERLSGTTSTDFGAPAAMPFGDARPLDSAELERLTTLLEIGRAHV